MRDENEVNEEADENPSDPSDSGDSGDSGDKDPRHYESVAALPSSLPLFPMPGALLFAREILPLNIFEPRYLALVDEILAHDRMIGIIQPLESDAEVEAPQLQSVGCAARLVSFEEAPDNRYLISLKGICRFDLQDELPLDKGGFRIARVSYDRFDFDLKPSDDAGRINRRGLLDVVKKYLDRNKMDANWDMIRQTPDESLVNYLCMVSPFGVRERQALLEARTLADRTDMMIALAEMLLAQDEGGQTPVH